MELYRLCSYDDDCNLEIHEVGEDKKELLFICKKILQRKEL